MKYKTRSSAKCTYKKKAESTLVAVCTSHTDMIYFQIFKFLEGCYLVGPSLHIFKIAMLNQKMNSFVKNTYEIENYNEFATLHAR